MKKWFKKAIIGLSTIGVCTIVPLAVVSCSSSTQQSNNSTNNSSNNSYTNNGSTTTPITNIDTVNVLYPYAKLTSTITNNPKTNKQFLNQNDALNNWSEQFNQVIQKNGFANVIRNDIFSYLQWNIKANYAKTNTFEQTLEITNISLNFLSNNSFNLSYTMNWNILANLNGNYLQAINWIETVNFQKATIAPCLIKHWMMQNNKTGIYQYFGGIFINNALFSDSVSSTSNIEQFKSNKNLYNTLNQTFNSLEKNVTSITTSIQYTAKSNTNYMTLQMFQNNESTQNFLSSYGYGTNYGNLKVANTNN